MASGDASGYTCGFNIYTRQGLNNTFKGHVTLDPTCSGTIKTVMGHLDMVQYFNTVRHLYSDNYYSSLQLCFIDTYMLVILSEVIEILPDAVIKAKQILDAVE